MIKSLSVLAVSAKALFLFVVLFCSLCSLQASEKNEYLELSLRDLLDIEVSSVSRKQELLQNAGAAVFVITADDIRRSGATSIPEALRMAPGITVGRIRANEWAISSRGFTGRFANKLLVQIDGRTVYTPSFSGVFWDVQDTILEDIEQIEVIRGPGATLWGSNAVNGIVNIITKQAIDTQGGLTVVGLGSHEKAFASLRYGSTLGDGGFGRAYLKYRKHADFTELLSGSNANDGWEGLRVGFRADVEVTAKDLLTLQGDVYHNNENQTIAQFVSNMPPFVAKVDSAFNATGWNLMARWERELAPGSSTSLQVYSDHTERDESLFEQEHDTFDIDFQHNFRWGERQQIVWGLGYRYIHEEVINSVALALVTDDPCNELFNLFVQDDIRLGMEDLHLVLGMKFEHNDFTGWESQPNVRLNWTVNESQTVWAAISRAIRTPSRLEVYGQAISGIKVVIPPLPPFNPVIVVKSALGNINQESEKITAYELGYRVHIGENFNIDIATYYNVYDELRSFEDIPLSPNVMADNKIEGYTYGFEVAADWQVQKWWQLRLAYTNFNIDLDPSVGGDDEPSIEQDEGGTPKHQVSLRSNMSLPSNLELDIWGRFNSKLTGPDTASLQEIDSYTELDVRLGWRPRENVEVAVVGQNLLHASHLEAIQESVARFIEPTVIERSMYIKVTLDF